MSYTALYRKYRPDTFEEVKGQDHVVTTLRNQIIAGRTSHAYLFTGSRGTGKTSVAKIFSRAVNCENPQNGSPCNECGTCRAILSGASMNVMEIDAASNNGVDNIRQIREEVAYPPPRGLFKVYIIDEVHMLSPGAFNALLKTLEEPPAYVKFILATTEVQKVPVTILSRCQRFDFHRISQEEITLRLRELLAQENIRSSDQALRYIARKAEGGMRDALSLTDQCISFYLGEELTYERVLHVLGAVDIQVLGALFRSVAVGDVAEVFSRLDEMIFQGRELTQLTTDFTEYLRDVLLVATTPEAEELLDTSEENMALLREAASLVSAGELLRYIRIFSEISGKLRNTAAKRTLLEVAMIRLCRPAMEPDVDALAARVSTLERLAQRGGFAAAAAPGRAGGRGGAGRDELPAGAETAGDAAGIRPEAGPDGAQARGSEPDGPAPVVYHRAAPEDLQRVEEAWKSIIDMLDGQIEKMAMKSSLRKYDSTDPAGDVLYVVCRGSIGDGYFQDRTAAHALTEQLESLIEERIGKRIHVRIISETQEKKDMNVLLANVRETAQRHIRVPIESVPD